MLLVALLSAFMGDEGDGVRSLKGLQTWSPHLPCRAEEHLVPLMRAGNWSKKGIAATLLARLAAESCCISEISQRLCTALVF